MSHATHHTNTVLLRTRQTEALSPGPQRRDDAVGAEAVQTLFGGHGVLQHVQTDGTHELAVQRARRHRHLCPVHDRLLDTHMVNGLYSYFYGQHFFYEGQFGVQYLAQGHFGMKGNKTGIKPPTFWLEDDRSTISSVLLIIYGLVDL